jgi:hypothetical protein
MPWLVRAGLPEPMGASVRRAVVNAQPDGLSAGIKGLNFESGSELLINDAAL